MDKYWLMAGDQYYPQRGLINLRGTYDSMSDLLTAFATMSGYDWATVVHVRDNEPHMTYSLTKDDG